MSAIIPYATAMEAGLIGPQLTADAYKDAKWLVRKTYKGAKTWARTTKSARKKRRTDETKKIGRDPRNSVARHSEVRSTSDTAIDSRTLYSYELTTIGANSEFEDSRKRGVINCKGFRLCFHVYNTDAQPKFFNVAILCPKHRSSGIATASFFRGDEGNRGENFDLTKTALELAYNPVNTDDYHVLRHYRYQMGSPSDSTQYNSDTGPVNWMSKKLYIPFKRQLTYDTTSSATCDTPIFFCYWYDRMRSGSGAAVETGDMNISFQHTMFFTDVL
jgi:hypothetical protein